MKLPRYIKTRQHICGTVQVEGITYFLVPSSGKLFDQMLKQAAAGLYRTILPVCSKEVSFSKLPKEAKQRWTEHTRAVLSTVFVAWVPGETYLQTGRRVRKERNAEFKRLCKGKAKS